VGAHSWYHKLSPEARVQIVLGAIFMTIFTLLVLFQLQVVNQINAGDRAVGCVLSIDPAKRTDAAVQYCFTSNGLQPPAGASL